MALPNRVNDVVLDIKDVTPNRIVKNHDWPDALPTELRRIVISYVLSPDHIVEEVKELDKQFQDNTMEPFERKSNRSSVCFKMTH